MEYTLQESTDAGRRLANVLLREPCRGDTVVLALPRGGVPVAAEIARALGVGLDVLVVRKLGHPLQPELAIGAVAEGGVRIMNRDVRWRGTVRSGGLCCSVCQWSPWATARVRSRLR